MACEWEGSAPLAETVLGGCLVEKDSGDCTISNPLREASAPCCLNPLWIATQKLPEPERGTDTRCHNASGRR